MIFVHYCPDATGKKNVAIWRYLARVARIAQSTRGQAKVVVTGILVFGRGGAGYIGPCQLRDTHRMAQNMGVLLTLVPVKSTALV
jgi:hypothetical protein